MACWCDQAARGAAPSGSPRAQQVEPLVCVEDLHMLSDEIALNNSIRLLIRDVYCAFCDGVVDQWCMQPS